ncbi:MAG: DUF1028 domain-containing protein, partial [Candidatus Rokubacteria bacterium]|nr:DUF1028 domain-containing protein [Candidatus Rokubacteria bacterium]
MDLHTFSIVARDPATGDLGIAVATARPNVGSLVPWASRRGAIATQARVNTELGRQGLALLDAGVRLDAALGALLEADEDRARRQVHAIDAAGRTFAHTGSECVAWCGHERGTDFSVAGNMLAGPQVIAETAAAYQSNAALPFAERLMAALAAGEAAGGDKRGKQGAALLINTTEAYAALDIRVD